MSAATVAWTWSRVQRLMTLRRFIIMAVVLGAVIAGLALLADAEGEHGVSIYTREMGTGSWTKQRISWVGGPGFSGEMVNRIRRILGLQLMFYPTTRRYGEIRQVLPGDVPYCAISQVARLLPSDRGWSFQIQVYDEPRRRTDSSGTPVTATGSSVRPWKAMVVGVKAKKRADFQDATRLDYMEEDGAMPIDILMRALHLREYWISIDDHDHVFELVQQDFNDPPGSGTHIDPDTVITP